MTRQDKPATVERPRMKHDAAVEEWERIQRRRRDLEAGKGAEYAENLKAMREGMRAAHGKPSTISVDLDVRREDWPVSEATTITVDELLQEVTVGEVLTGDYIRAAMTTPPHDASVADMMTAGAFGFWEIRRIPKVPRGTNKRRHLTRTRRIQAFRRWQRAARIEAESWVIQSVDEVAQTVIVRFPCEVTVRPWRSGRVEPTDGSDRS